VFTPEAGTASPRGAAELTAVADTLRRLPIPGCWIREAPESGKPDFSGSRYRPADLAGLPGTGSSGGSTPATRAALSPELFFTPGREYDVSELRVAPWRNLFRGVGAICWTGVYGKVGDALVPGGGLNPSFSVLAGECRRIREGIDLLLSGAGRDGVVLIPDRPGAEALLFRDGSVRYVGILPSPGGGSDSTGSAVTVKIPDSSRPMHLYDVREGSYRGQTTDISFPMKGDEAELFALLPYRVKDIDIRFSGGVVRAGGTLDFEAEIIPQETGEKPGRHVLGVRLFGPDGNERAWLRVEREAPGGTLKMSMPLPFGESQGKWTLQVRDVLSGKKTERPFIIMPSGDTAGK
jgi:hypothetical protein